MKAYTDIKQSKNLAKVLSINTADMRYGIIEPYEFSDRMYDGGYSEIPYMKDFFKKNPDVSETELYDGELPAWSLAALINILPSEINIVGEYSTSKYEIDIRKYKFTDKCDLYQIAYGNHKIKEDGSSSWKDMINTGEKEDLIDAVFEMVVWLKEKGKI